MLHLKGSLTLNMPSPFPSRAILSAWKSSSLQFSHKDVFCPSLKSHFKFFLKILFWQAKPTSNPLLQLCVLRHFSRVWLFVTLWTTAHQAPLSMGFSRQEYWSGLPCSPPGDIPDPRIKPMFLRSPALAGRIFTTSATREAPKDWQSKAICWHHFQRLGQQVLPSWKGLWSVYPGTHCRGYWKGKEK